MSRSREQTFIAACLDGGALLEDIDEWVDRWHRGAGVDDLDEFLGFTDAEGQLWAERPESLRFVVAAHRYDRTVADLMAGRDEFALAARAGSPEDAERVQGWLRDTGRLD